MLKRRWLNRQRREPPLEVHVSAQEEGVIVVECAGEIDIRTAGRFGEGLRTALRATRMLVVDLRRVTRIDSTGIGQIAGACKRLLPGARLQIRSEDQRVRILLQIAGLGHLAAASARLATEA